MTYEQENEIVPSDASAALMDHAKERSVVTLGGGEGVDNSFGVLDLELEFLSMWYKTVL